MEIRQCRAEDLDRLEQWHPTGLTQLHALRFGRQQTGASTFLIAWSQGSPVGSGEILWEGCAAPEVRERYPRCPELNGLQVWPQTLRSRGIGTAIIHAAEDMAWARGYESLGMGADDTNDRAAALYRRLGYTDTNCRYLDRYHYVADDGARHEVADPARFLIKIL